VRLRIDTNPSVMVFDKPQLLLRAPWLPKLDLAPDPSRLPPTHWMSRRERFTCHCDGPRLIMPRSPRGTARICTPVSCVPPRRTAAIGCGDSSSSSPRGSNVCPERACCRRKYHRTNATPAANQSTLKTVPMAIAVLFISEPPNGFPLFPGPSLPVPVPAVLDGSLVFELVPLYQLAHFDLG
jgi:hypothetical protein